MRVPSFYRVERRETRLPGRTRPSHFVRHAGRGRFPSAALFVVLLAPVFYGGMCSTSACFEDCDPCLQTCKCPDNTCNQALSIGNEDDLRLESYVLAVDIGTDGSVARSYRSILGPSLARAYPGRAQPSWERSDFVRFADGVLRVNADLFGRAPGPRRVSVERFGPATVVSFERKAADHDVAIDFLIDGDGHLVEIVEHHASDGRG